MGLDIYFNRVKRQQLEVGYFRKVNFLVRFFEDKTDEEVPNCQGINVPKEWAEDLLDRCNKVLAAKEDILKYYNVESEEELQGVTAEDVAADLLPTMSGFFFGNTDYDEYYYKDVEEVRDNLINNILPQYDDLDNDEFIEFFIWY